MGDERRMVGGKEVRTRALVRIFGAMEAKGGWWFQAKHVKGIDNKLTDGITRCQREDIQSNLTTESPQTVWQVQELGGEEKRMYYHILREDTPWDWICSRLGNLTMRIGRCG